LITAALVIAVSAAAAAVTGFGFNLVSAPLLTLFYPPRFVVAWTLLLGLVSSGLLCLRDEIRREVDARLIGPLYLSSVAGMPLGMALLAWGPTRLLKAGIAAVTAAFALIMLTRFRPRLRGGPFDTIATGFLSGILSTSTSLNGPPVALYLMARGLSKEKFRSNMVVYVFFATATSIVLLAAGRTMTAPMLMLALQLLPVLLAGFAGGVLMAKGLSDRGFEATVLGFLVLVGLLGLGSALR
jgi:uncharacterized membrane protein YfcA